MKFPFNTRTPGRLHSIPASRHAYAGREGFTLMEVLVSSALTLVVLSMLFGVLMGAMSAWQTGTTRLQGNADARMALDMITRDLQSLVARQTTTNQQWLVSGRIDISENSNPYGNQTTWLTFFSPSLDRDPGQEGDIVAVSYRVGYLDPMTDDANSNYKIFGLYKDMATTEDTFINALGQEDIINGFWMGRNPLARRGLIVPHVVDLDIQWHLLLADGQRATERQYITLNNQADSTSYPAPAIRRIEAADVSLTIVSEEGARRLQLLARSGSVTNDQLQSVVREFGRVFTKRVNIEY